MSDKSIAASEEIIEAEYTDDVASSPEVAIVPIQSEESARDVMFRRAIETYIAGMAENSRRAYSSRLKAFIAWLNQQGDAEFVTHLRRYVGYLRDECQLSPRSVQAHINTIKGMLKTAAALEPSLTPMLSQLQLVKAPVVRGQLHGLRLNSAQAQALLDAPGTDSVKGLRDSAILGLLLTLGMRRSEICNLTWGHITELDGHRVIANLKGKHGRVRTLKLPVWLWRMIMRWGEESRTDMSNPERRVFVPITKDGHVLRVREGFTPHAIYKMLIHYTKQAGIPPVKPHDLRRTAALLARRGGASIEQVQIMLGHASPQTTSSYIGETLNLDDNAVDYNQVRLRSGN
jgi:site-specific recombinase XerD